MSKTYDAPRRGRFSFAKANMAGTALLVVWESRWLGLRDLEWLVVDVDAHKLADDLKSRSGHPSITIPGKSRRIPINDEGRIFNLLKTLTSAERNVQLTRNQDSHEVLLVLEVERRRAAAMGSEDVIDMSSLSNRDQEVSPTLGLLIMAAGFLAAAVCTYSVATMQWPIGALYLFGVLGGVVTFFYGLRKWRRRG